MKELFTNIRYKGLIWLGLFLNLIAPSIIRAQTVLFDFDNVPVHTPFPVSQTVSGTTAYFSGTGQGYSIQDANTMGFTPAGFSGHVIYPNSIYLADLLINFNQKMTDFSIMYSCQELGCDDAATMRVTAYWKGTQVATNTKVASFPGTWPVDTLRCSYTHGFDSLVVHYDKRPPTCKDYGVIFLADNMYVTPYKTSVSTAEQPIEKFAITNPISGSAVIFMGLSSSEHINITIFDITGRPVSNIYNGYLPAGENTLNWTVDHSILKHGIYLIRVSGENTSKLYKVMVE